MNVHDARERAPQQDIFSKLRPVWLISKTHSRHIEAHKRHPDSSIRWVEKGETSSWIHETQGYQPLKRQVEETAMAWDKEERVFDFVLSIQGMCHVSIAFTTQTIWLPILIRLYSSSANQISYCQNHDPAFFRCTFSATGEVSSPQTNTFSIITLFRSMRLQFDVILKYSR